MDDGGDGNTLGHTSFHWRISIHSSASLEEDATMKYVLLDVRSLWVRGG